MLQSRLTVAAVREIRICECFWEEAVEKQAQFPQTALAAVTWLGNVLQMKNWEILVYLKRPANGHTHECFLSQSFSSGDTGGAAVSKLNRRSLQRESYPFPFGNRRVAAITRWTMAMCAAVPSPDGISRQGWAFTRIVACLIFRAENWRIYPQFWVNQHLSGDFNLCQSLTWPITSLFMGAFTVEVSSWAAM